MDIVLYSPEIPQNTGSIARSCAATCTPLHLIRPMKFEIDEKKVRRAGLDYWPYVDLTIHETWDAYVSTKPGALFEPLRYWFFTKWGTAPYYHAKFHPEDTLVFGNETSGLPEEFLQKFPESQYLAIPMAQPEVRSINLSNAVSIALYEARRQLKLDEPFHMRKRPVG